MDYPRIYREFIADRKAREAGLTGYTERHHILPRSMGGGDEADNLIRLTPEDHYFAHCLLAKMHGGGMWMALHMMGCRRNGAAVHWTLRRPMYGLARLRVAALTSAKFKGQDGRRGSDNGRYCDEVLRWTNMDGGQVVLATKWEMWDTLGGCRAHWTSASTGARKTMKGWTTTPDAVVTRSSKGMTFDFVNRDGRTFTGTQSEFRRTFGLNAASASRVTRHASVTVCGWRLKGVGDRPHNKPKRRGHSPDVQHGSDPVRAAAGHP